MKKMKLIASATALSMIAALSLTGCGGGGSSQEAESDNTITVWAWDVALKQLELGQCGRWGLYAGRDGLEYKMRRSVECISGNRSGQSGKEVPVEGMKRFICALLKSGFSPAEIRDMVQKVPEELVGEVGWQNVRKEEKT
ncbi:hypothetical protein CL3_00510 [butyrate-producing bacterium SM4/1]|nr:hypothetical protein CL3_00510 [butyrate-producing bacterium SM4/1]